MAAKFVPNTAVTPVRPPRIPMTDIFVFVQQSLDFAKGIAGRVLRAGGSSAGYR
jgi:hypothetical protein